MGLSIKRFDDNDFFLSGSVTTNDGETYVMEGFGGKMSYFDFEIPILNIPSLKVWYPSCCDFLCFYLGKDRYILSTSHIPYIFRELFNVGYFNKLSGVKLECGMARNYPSNVEWRVSKFVVNVPIYWYYGSQIWLEVPYESFIEYDFDMVEKADFPEWFRRKYIPVTKRKKALTENEKIDLLMRLMPKDK